MKIFFLSKFVSGKIQFSEIHNVATLSPSTILSYHDMQSITGKIL